MVKLRFRFVAVALVVAAFPAFSQEAELSFYGRIFGFTPAGAEEFEALEIAGL